MNRKCKNHPNNFCFICGKVVLAGQSSNITSFLKASYHAYFGLKLGDQDKEFAPHICCRTCVEYLRRWSTGKIKALPFGIPMMWREGKDHVTDCYFCLTNIQGVNKKNKYCVKYPDVPSAIKPVPHGPDIPVPDPPQSLKLDSVSDDEISTVDTSETYVEPSCSQNDPQPLTQSQLNDLTRDLGLSKESSQLLGSRLRESNLLALETTFYWYRNRDQEFRQFFSRHDTTSLIYCSDIKGLIEALGVMYRPSEWRLFIDSSSRSLKAVLLHNGNGLGSVPVGYSIQLTENYENLKTLLDVLKYNDHQWKLCCDLKVITLILGMQGGYTKYPCFLCLWDSRADDKHFKQNQWQPRISFRPGFQNVVAQPLLDRNRILLPPLHIKLGLMKNYVKAMNKESDAFLYIHKKFPHISDGKLLAGIFDGPQIRSLMKDDEFEVTMNQIEKEAWINFKLITTNFLGNHRNPQYKDMVKNLLESFKKMGVRMSIKIHFLASHLEYFPANCGDFSEEQGERFHQDVRTMEERYQGRWDINMMADYCWCLKRDEPVKTHKRKAIRSSFLKNNLEM